MPWTARRPQCEPFLVLCSTHYIDQRQARLSIADTMLTMTNPNDRDYGTRERRAYCAGWLAALRGEGDGSPYHQEPRLDRRWSDGFQQGHQLRQSWDDETQA